MDGNGQGAGGLQIAPPLQNGDHYVLQKLCNDLLPWMIAGRRVRKRWFCKVSFLYGYSDAVMAAMAGLGIGAPLIALSKGEVEQGKSAWDVLHETLPEPWFAIGAVAAIGWVIIRIVVQREDVVGRALLAKNCSEDMKGLRVKLWKSLSQATPILEINEIDRVVQDRVQDAIEKRIWKWDSLPPPAEIADELTAAVNDIRGKYMHLWAPMPGANQHG